jgi:copper/silver efflux system protein
MISSTLLTLIVIPAIFGLVKGFGLPREPAVNDRTWTGGQTAANKHDHSEAVA